MIHWRIPFRTKYADDLYYIDIYDDNYTSTTPVMLTGAKEPFITQEDDNDNLFQPVRTQSGYLRIFDTGYDADGNVFDWRDLIPTTDVDRPVILHDRAGNIMWQGFMQAQDFGAALYGNPQVRSFPIQCPLSVISAIDINYDNKPMRNFAFLLQTVVNGIPSTCRPTKFIVQGSTDAQTWLLQKIDWQNFVESNEDFNPYYPVESINKSKYSLQECLEYLCKFWGWTARIYVDTLFLVCAEDPDEREFLMMTTENLSTMAAGTAAGYTGRTFLPYENDTVSPIPVVDNFADTDSEDFQTRGFNEAIVEDDINAADTSIIRPFDEDLEAQMDSPGAWSYYDGYQKTNDVLTVERTGFYASATSGKASFNAIRETFYADVYSVIMIKQRYDGSSFLRIQTLYEHCFADGFFVLEGETFKGIEKYVNESDGIGIYDMRMRLGIGSSPNNAIWWNGNSWSNSQDEFKATLGNSGSMLYSRTINESFVRNPIYTDINNNNVGYLYIELLGSDDFPFTSGVRSFNLSNFHVSFYRNDAALVWGDRIKEKRIPKSYKYESKNNNPVKKTYEVSNIFCTDAAMPFAYASIVDPTTNKFTEEVPYNGDTEKPEIHLSKRISNYNSTSRRKVKAKMLTHNGSEYTGYADISPRHVANVDGTTMYPACISRNWEEDVIEFLFLEI